MVFARVANFFTSGNGAPGTPDLPDDGRGSISGSMDGKMAQIEVGVAGVGEVEVDHEAARPPYIHVGARREGAFGFG
jgi:hypothetical protein